MKLLSSSCFSVTIDGISRRFVRNPIGPSPPTIMTGSDPEFDNHKFVAAPVMKGWFVYNLYFVNNTNSHLLGSLVLIHGEVVHRSYANRSKKSRHVYTFHVVETANTTYSKDNW